jgi:hypothetical protein
MRFSILAAFFLGQAAFGSTIVSSIFTGGSDSGSGGLYAVSWTQTDTYTNVTIDANIAVANGNPSEEATGTAYLMTEIGPGATTAEEVASGPVSVLGNPGINAMTQIFKSLTLGPGTYYLVIDPSDFNMVDSLDWDKATTPTQSFGAGVSDAMTFVADGTAASFVPASSFTSNDSTPIFSVTGDLSATPTAAPEPSTTILLACGLAALAIRRKALTRKETRSVS